MEARLEIRDLVRSELGIGHNVRRAFRTGGIMTWGRNLAVKTNRQHNARRDILIEPAARQRAAIEARGIPNWGHSEVWAFGTGGAIGP